MPLRNGGFVFYVDVWAFFNRPAVGLFALRNISQLVRGRTMCASTSVVILRQYRIILSADTASEVRQMPSQKRR